MKYVDKTTGATVELRDSRSDFLVLRNEDDGESLRTAVGGGIFSVRQSTNADNVLVLSARSDSESAQGLEQAVKVLAASPGVVAVVPAQIDINGGTRFLLPGSVTVQVRAESARDIKAVIKPPPEMGVGSFQALGCA